MAMVAGAGMPTRTDLLNWDYQHLSDAATAWWNQAQAWEDVFHAICVEVHNPAGTEWTGITAAAAQAASLADLHQVSGWADQLREAARVAHFGAATIEHAKYAVVDAIELTKADGYEVLEDLTVVPGADLLTAISTGRVSPLDVLHILDRIRDHFLAIDDAVTQLLAHDQQIAAEITRHIAPLADIAFTGPAPTTAPAAAPADDAVTAPIRTVAATHTNAATTATTADARPDTGHTMSAAMVQPDLTPAEPKPATPITTANPDATPTPNFGTLQPRPTPAPAGTPTASPVTAPATTPTAAIPPNPQLRAVPTPATSTLVPPATTAAPAQIGGLGALPGPNPGLSASLTQLGTNAISPLGNAPIAATNAAAPTAVQAATAPQPAPLTTAHQPTPPINEPPTPDPHTENPHPAKPDNGIQLLGHGTPPPQAPPPDPQPDQPAPEPQAPPPPPPDPTVAGPAAPPVEEQNDYDLQDQFPDGQGSTYGGDQREYNDDGTTLSGLPRSAATETLREGLPPGTRVLPTGVAMGPDGHKYVFVSHAPDHPALGDNPFVSNGSVFDVTDPAHPKLVGTLPNIFQATGAYDPATGRMVIIGNDSARAQVGLPRSMWISDPITPGDPNGWLSTLKHVGPVGLPGDREAQLARLPGPNGGWLLVGADDNGTISAITAHTIDGLKNPVNGPVTLIDEQRLTHAYGPTIRGLHYDPATGQVRVDMRVSNWIDHVKPPDFPADQWDDHHRYNPKTFNTHFNINTR